MFSILNIRQVNVLLSYCIEDSYSPILLLLLEILCGGCFIYYLGTSYKNSLRFGTTDTELLFQVYGAVSHLVESSLCMEAVSVLEAVLQSSSNGSAHSETHPTGSLQENGAVNNVPRSYRRTEDPAPSPQRVLVPQNSFKLRNSGQQPWTGPGGPMLSGAVSPVAADILPSRSESTIHFSFPFSVALINTF